MSLQVDNLEQFRHDGESGRRNGTIYLIPKDEPRPIEDLRRWELPKISPRDFERVDPWSGKRYDMYTLPKEVVDSLHEPAVSSSSAATCRVSVHDEFGRTGQQLQTNSSEVDGRPKELPTFRESKDYCRISDQSSPPPYPVIPAPSVVIDIPVNPEPPTPPNADQPLPSLSTLHAKLGEIVQKYTCCYRQIIAAEEVLGNDFDVTFKSQQRVLTSTKKLKPTLFKLGKALTELERVQWKESIFEPFQTSTTSDVGKVLQDLDSFAGEVVKLSEYLRFFAFHAELVWEDATQLIGPQAPDAKYLQQVCARLERRVKGVNLLVTGEAME